MNSSRSCICIRIYIRLVVQISLYICFWSSYLLKLRACYCLLASVDIFALVVPTSAFLYFAILKQFHYTGRSWEYDTTWTSLFGATASIVEHVISSSMCIRVASSSWRILRFFWNILKSIAPVAALQLQVVVLFGKLSRWVHVWIVIGRSRNSSFRLLIWFIYNLWLHCVFSYFLIFLFLCIFTVQTVTVF